MPSLYIVMDWKKKTQTFDVKTEERVMWFYKILFFPDIQTSVEFAAILSLAFGAAPLPRAPRMSDPPLAK